MSNSIPFTPDPAIYTIGLELTSPLGNLLQTARDDFNPRNFGERHLVDEMAIAKWRGLRVTLMEKAIFDHERTTFRPRKLKDAAGKLLEPLEDLYHLATAHAPGRHAVVLAALGRLETRYQRHFCAVLRLLIALRRGTPPPVQASDLNPSTSTNESGTITERTTTEKETPTCSPSPNSVR